MEAERFARIELTLIDPPSHQLRESIDAGALGELCDSMASEGLHQPIGLRGPDDGGRFEVVWGHRRFLAAQQLGWADIAARVFVASFDPLLAAVSENLQREQLTAVEEARAVEKMRALGLPLVEVARRFRRSASWVRDRLDLLEQPVDIQRAVQEKVLPLAVASALARVDHEKLRAAYIAEAARTGATAATVEIWVAHYLADRDRIVSNHETVEQIVASRGTFVIYTSCESCAGEVPFDQTRAWRFCSGCSAVIGAAIKEREADEARGNGAARH